MFEVGDGLPGSKPTLKRTQFFPRIIDEIPMHLAGDLVRVEGSGAQNDEDFGQPPLVVLFQLAYPGMQVANQLSVPGQNQGDFHAIHFIQTGQVGSEVILAVAQVVMLEVMPARM